MSSSDREASYSHSYNRKGLCIMDIRKNLIFKVQLASEKRRNSLRDEFLLYLILCKILFGRDSNFDALTLPYFFFIKLHAYQFTIYISFEKKIITKAHCKWNVAR